LHERSKAALERSCFRGVSCAESRQPGNDHDRPTPILDKFIGDLHAIWAANAENKDRMEKARPVLEEFVKHLILREPSALCRS